MSSEALALRNWLALDEDALRYEVHSASVRSWRIEYETSTVEV